ncbi:uncharacterized protein [Cicer arietinum]|uniref:uncharacterized protein n=1 Tax=Cicer arietinum TaxID=3827 RepID=UPI003CC5C4C5
MLTWRLIHGKKTGFKTPTFVHECGLTIRLGKLPLYSSFLNSSGPAISQTRPDKAEQPGPPVSQSITGSSFGFFSDSMK